MKFVVNKSSEKIFKQGLRSFFEYSNLGIDLATNGDYGANIIKAVAGKHLVGKWHSHAVNFQMVYIIEGWIKFEYENEGVFLLKKGDSVLQPPNINHREIEHSEDLVLIEITSPAEFESINI